MTATLERVSEQISQGKLDEAKQALEQITPQHEREARAHFLNGLLKEKFHETIAALECYEKALELDEHDKEAAFRAALIYDRIGDDQRAIDLYERCTSDDQAHVNALINLAVLYEDNGRLDEADVCLHGVLEGEPNHWRARHFLKSVESCFTMVYDERTQREREQRNAILDAPITDFELSVRSRNCLRQMNIKTIGDLLRTTEGELLSYKNFGETSLAEIKSLLSAQELELGQSLHPPRAPSPLSTQDPSGPAAINLQRSIAELELSIRSRKCLQRLGINTLAELTQRSESELMANKNFGQTSLNEIKRQLASFGLSLRT